MAQTCYTNAPTELIIVSLLLVSNDPVLGVHYFGPFPHVGITINTTTGFVDSLPYKPHQIQPRLRLNPG